jgi:hypothetical protein
MSAHFNEVRNASTSAASCHVIACSKPSGISEDGTCFCEVI